MLYLIYGDDFKKARERLDSLVLNMVSKKPNISVLKINEENLKDYDLVSLAQDQGLFEKEVIIIFYSIFASGLLKEEIKEKLNLISKSKNTFIVIENLLDKKTLDLLKKSAEKTEEFIIKNKEISVFNPFSLADSLGEKNKKLLWLQYLKALYHGSAPEEIHGLLFWQIKSMLISKTAKNQEESGLKPFVYTKSKRFVSKFSVEDLKNLSTELVEIHHKSRLGLFDLSDGLERFILKI